MIGALCSLTLGMLGVRSLVMISEHGRPAAVRVLDLIFSLFFLLVSALAFFLLGMRIADQSPKLFLLALIPVGLITLSLILRLRKPYRRRPNLYFLKIIGTLLLLIATLFSIMVSGFRFLTEDEPVFRVTLTGRIQPENVEWKSPEGQLTRETLSAYEVQIDSTDSTPLARLYVYGDQVAVKARVLRLRPILNAAGIRNLCRVDYIYNGYTTAERYNRYPHRAQEIETTNRWLQPFQARFWDYWETAYFLRSSDPWVKSATLESTFFPLITPDGTPFRGSFFLTITPGGLSSIPAP